MGFWDDFGDGFQMPFRYVYNKLEKVDGVVNKGLDAVGNVVGAAGGLAGGLADLLSGNSNFLLYMGIGIVGIVALPILLNKFL